LPWSCCSAPASPPSSSSSCYLFGPSYARLIRTQTLSIKARDFIKAEQAMNAGLGRILFVHLLPNVIGPLLILACLDMSTIITLEAGLSFLGLGVKPQIPSWGNILLAMALRSSAPRRCP
jgi:ABC-type dipeptide/oligopeptide/nickel transport system permease subunit